MTYQDVVEYFGTQVRIAAALGITQSTVSLWNGVIPDKYQYQIEVITDRALLADSALRGPKNDVQPAAAS